MVPLTMTPLEYAQARGTGVRSVYDDLAAGRIPHILVGKRNRIRILRRPAMALLTGERNEPEVVKAPR
ncbi:MAG: hypothetical protein WBW87_01470 [Candidatus Cybelea sp.]